MKFTLGCRTLPDGESANVIGDIPGRETPKEIVLLGAHLDSWDLGTGALDDAAGCGIVIEAARQIGQLPRRPRRTIRVVLFANEEHGLKGGKAYAEAHAAELADHVAAMEADLGQGPPLGFSWNAGRSAEAVLKAIAGLLAPIGADALVEYDVGGADLIYLLPSGIPSLGLSLDATDVLRLSPHGQRQLRPHRPADPGPVDGGRGDARLRARGDPDAPRTHSAGEAGAAGAGRRAEPAPQPSPLTRSRTAWTSGCWKPRSSAMRRAS